MTYANVFTSVINSYLPEPHAQLLNGIIFGVSLQKHSLFFEQLRYVGLLHMVVLSGSNISILSSMIGTVFLHFGKRVSTLITIIFLTVFVWLVGPQAPSIRAVIFAIFTSVAVISGRKTEPFYLLLLSVFISFAFFSDWITTLSFQLSYAATIGLILFAPRENTVTTIYDYIKRDFQISLAAQIFTAPLVFLAFRQISLISPISNIFISFLIPPLMIFGFATAIFGKIHFLLGLPFATACYGILTYMIFVIEFLSKVPFGMIKF